MASAAEASGLLGGSGRMPARQMLAAIALCAAALCAVALAFAGGALRGAPAARLQVLAMGDAYEARPQSPDQMAYIGEIPVSDVFDYGLLDRPAVDAAHALCNKDTDPDCETSIAPLVDRAEAPGMQTLAGSRGPWQRPDTRPGVSKAKTQSLIMPWYEVSSTGDGMGPESVTYWKLPPKAQFMQAQKAEIEKAADDAAQTLAAASIDAKATDTTTLKDNTKVVVVNGAGGFPAPPNTYQEPTVWNGDHVLNGGNKEWAEEDGALHAYNMQRWRNKILGEQIDRQRSQWDLMNEADWCDCNCGARGNNGWQFKGARGTCGHRQSGGCGCSGQPGCGCSSTNNEHFEGGHSPGNNAHDHSTASQSTDYGYHASNSNSESGRGVHVSVTGHGHHVTVNGHSASDFGGGVVNSNSDSDGGGYQCHSCHDPSDAYGYHGRYDRRWGRYDRRRGSRSSDNDDAPVLVDGEVPPELLDRFVGVWVWVWVYGCTCVRV